MSRPRYGALSSTVTELERKNNVSSGLARRYAVRVATGGRGAGRTHVPLTMSLARARASNMRPMTKF